MGLGEAATAGTTGPRPDPGRPATRRRRALLIALAVAAVLTAIALGALWLTARGAAASGTPTRDAELAALDTRLQEVRAAITPIAASFTSLSSSATIDVDSYRARIAAARRIVDGVNGEEVADADAQQIRDLIVTGGSQVLAGMDLALDALVSDEASATEPAATQVDEGLQRLQEARDLLDTLRGRASLTRSPLPISTGAVPG